MNGPRRSDQKAAASSRAPQGQKRGLVFRALLRGNIVIIIYDILAAREASMSSPSIRREGRTDDGDQ
jgi:hypothetical protein